MLWDLAGLILLGILVGLIGIVLGHMLMEHGRIWGFVIMWVPMLIAWLLTLGQQRWFIRWHQDAKVFILMPGNRTGPTCRKGYDGNWFTTIYSRQVDRCPWCRGYHQTRPTWLLR